MPLTEENKRKFEPFPTRGITMSDQVWEELKLNKVKFGSNWNGFIKHINELLKNKENKD